MGEPTVLRALRIIDGEPRIYEPTWCGARFVDQIVRQARATGQALTVEECPDDYALIDVLDADGDIVGEWAVPDARAFRWWYQQLGLRVAAVPEEAW